MKPWRCLPLLAALVLAGPAFAAAPATPERAAQDDDIRIRGVFDSALPRTERKNSLRLIVHPHLGDFTNSDYLRTALGFRYGVTRNLEATAEVDAFFAHGLKSRALFSESGFSTLRLGAKYNLGDPLALGWDTSIGADWSRPLGLPPAQITDGRKHLAPYVTFSHQLAEHPEWRVFFGAGYDFVTVLGIPSTLKKNDLGDDAASVSGGFLYQRGLITYTLEAAYATMHITKDLDRDRYTLRPGFVWVIPSKYTPAGREGKWLLGFALNLSKGPDGYDLGASAKLRANFDFKKLIGRKRAPSASP